MSSFKGAYNEQVLKGISLAYLNEQDSFIAEKIAPEVPVVKESAKIASYGADSIRLVNTIRATGANSSQVDLTTSLATHYVLEDHALHDYVSYEDYENAEDPIDPQADTVEHLTQLVALAKEYSLATAMQATATYTGGNYVTLSGGSVWSDYVNSDPFRDMLTGINTIRSKSMKMANTLILPYDTLMNLLLHPKVQDKLGIGLDMTQERLFAVIGKVLGIQNVLVAKAQYNSAGKGATMALGELWTDCAILAYIEQTPRIKSQTFALTYAKTDERKKVNIVKKNANSVELTDRNADFMRINDKYDQVIVNNLCGYLIKNTN